MKKSVFNNLRYLIGMTGLFALLLPFATQQAGPHPRLRAILLYIALDMAVLLLPLKFALWLLAKRQPPRL